MTKPPRIVEDGPYRQAPLVASMAVAGLGAAALLLVPFELRDLPPPPPIRPAPAKPESVAPLQPAPLESRLLQDLRAQEKTMRQARRFLPSSSNFRTLFERDLASVRDQIEAEQRRLEILRTEGYTPEVVCGDAAC